MPIDQAGLKIHNRSQMAPVAIKPHQMMSVVLERDNFPLCRIVRVTKSLEGCPVR